MRKIIIIFLTMLALLVSCKSLSDLGTFFNITPSAPEVSYEVVQDNTV